MVGRWGVRSSKYSARDHSWHRGYCSGAHGHRQGTIDRDLGLLAGHGIQGDVDPERGLVEIVSVVDGAVFGTAGGEQRERGLGWVVHGGRGAVVFFLGACQSGGHYCRTSPLRHLRLGHPGRASPRASALQPVASGLSLHLTHRDILLRLQLEEGAIARWIG